MTTVNEIGSTFAVTVTSLDDDLEQVVSDINQAAWDDANEITPYDSLSLAAYLKCQDTLFLTCYNNTPTSTTLLGIASARFEMKPYDQEKWLYIDELDVCADQRNRGAGTAIMRKLIDLAEINGCEEVWLGTEPDNTAANALYNNIVQFIGYTYEIDE